MTLHLQSRLVPREHRPERRRPERSSTSAHLGVAWLNGHLELSAESARGAESWSAPGLVQTSDELAAALKEGTKALGVAGGSAALLLAHAQLAHAVVEVPPASGSVVRRLLDREAERLKPFAGPAVWRDEAAASVDSRAARLLHLFPRCWHDDLVGAFRRNGFDLKFIHPVSETVRKLAGNGSPGLFAALIPGALILTVGRADGPLLVRSVPLSDPTAEKVLGEIRRTLSFTRQQYSVAVERVGLSGPAPILDSLKARLSDAGITVDGCHPDLPGQWAQRARSYTNSTQTNLLTHEQRQAPRRRAVFRWSRGLGLLVLLLAIGLSAVSEGVRRQGLADLQDLEIQRRQWETRLGESRRLIEELRWQRQWTATWDAATRAPLHRWLPAVLADALPVGLVVTNLALTPAETGWQVALTGVRSGGGTPSTVQLVAQLAARLETSPLAVAIDLRQPTGTEAIHPAGSWTRRLQETEPIPVETTTQFRVEGVVP